MSKSKYTNEFKSEIWKSGQYQEWKDEYKQIVNQATDTYYNASTGEYETYYNPGMVKEWNDECSSYAIFDCCRRMKDSRKGKVKRIKQKVAELVKNGDAIFVTLTFTDKTLKNTTKIKRRRAVQRYLKANSTNYIGNLDYGGKNGREHYHAIVDSKLKLDDWFKYGSIDVENIGTSDIDLAKVANYVAKLTMHALKETTDITSTRLIYSRESNTPTNSR